MEKHQKTATVTKQSAVKWVTRCFATGQAAAAGAQATANTDGINAAKMVKRLDGTRLQHDG